MEAGESNARQSGLVPANRSDRFDPRPRDIIIDRPYRGDGPNMATATLVNPASAFNPHAHPTFPSYPTAPSTTSIPSMLSPVDSRRTSDDSETHHRPSLPSLPSISEVFSGSKPSAYSAQPSGPTPTTPSLPSPYTSSAPTRSYSDPPEKNPSPRTLHPSSTFPPRPEALPAFSDPARASLSVRPPMPSPLNTFPRPQISPLPKGDQMDTDSGPTEPRQVNGGYQYPPMQSGSNGLYVQTGHLPPGQLPLSAGYPASPRQGPPSVHSPYDPTPQNRMYGSEDEYNYRGGNEYKSTVDRAFETWNYVDALRMVSIDELWWSLIGSSARTIYNFAEAFDAAAREQQGGQPIPSRLPTEREVSLMIDNCLIIKKKLEEVREMAQQNRVNLEHRSRENGGRRSGGYDDEEGSMYGEMKQSFNLDHVKKRRGRAAPPGRCHSCNRIDTPEWRRGPDGARTLCNACGLHYAKLERKRQIEQRSLRPKPSDDR